VVAGVRDQYSGDCERVQVVDSTGDAGCSVTAMKRLIFIFRITRCYPLTVPTLIKYSHSMLTFKP